MSLFAHTIKPFYGTGHGSGSLGTRTKSDKPSRHGAKKFMWVRVRPLVACRN